MGEFLPKETKNMFEEKKTIITDIDYKINPIYLPKEFRHNLDVDKNGLTEITFDSYYEEWKIYHNEGVIYHEYIKKEFLPKDFEEHLVMDIDSAKEKLVAIDTKINYMKNEILGLQEQKEEIKKELEKC